MVVRFSRPSENSRPAISVSDAIRERGPLTVAAFMELALYDPEFGYYARSAQRSGRAGDFFTSVDVGALFGELLELQIAEMFETLAGRTTPTAGSKGPGRPESFDLVEAGAGNGRLSADILNAARARHPQLYERTQLHLVESSAAARSAHVSVLGASGDRLKSSAAELPPAFAGVLFANELLDAMPVHQVVMREDGLREVYVEAGKKDPQTLNIREGPLSTAAIADYFARLQMTLQPGWRAEVNLRAIEWITDAAQRLTRGFMILVDYGHEARELYSVTHATGTLTTYAAHKTAGPEVAADAARPPWLLNPGEQDLTAHVDFTSVRWAAAAAGLTTLGFLDQTYFVMGLLPLLERHDQLENWSDPASVRRRLALKTLLLPGGLGSTMKVLIFGKGVGTPVLSGCSYRMRVT
jgi:SAM-dependent MidA family methyltransferase